MSRQPEALTAAPMEADAADDDLWKDDGTGIAAGSAARRGCEDQYCTGPNPNPGTL